MTDQTPLTEAIEAEQLVAFYGALSHDPDQGKLRRCLGCGRTSAIVPIVASLADAPVRHTPDCAVAGVLATIAAEREKYRALVEALKQARLGLIQDVDPDAVILGIDAALEDSDA